MTKPRETAAAPTRDKPKKVVYLIGAGATQAEIDYLGARPANLLMRDNEKTGLEGVATRLVKKLEAKWRSAFETDKGTDIEKVISLLTASSVGELTALAEQMRKLYFEDIRDSLADAMLLRQPRLAIGLLQLHSLEEFQRVETLSGVLTTNHDGLFQLASQEVYTFVNLGFPFQSGADLTDGSMRCPPLLSLHGSFTWTFGAPLVVSPLSETSAYGSDTVWIPPTILKESKSYPFNKLAGLAYELLCKHCDVLRVVGSSLTQNDWNVLSLLFNAQRHREITDDAAFKIELIMSHRTGSYLVKECSFLRQLTPIGFVSDGDFSVFKEEEPEALEPETRNAFFFWLKSKVKFHGVRGELGSAPLPPGLAEIQGEQP